MAGGAPKGSHNNPRGWAAAHTPPGLTRNQQIFSQLEKQLDISRGEQRLAAEVVLYQIAKGSPPPVDSILPRALNTLHRLATEG